MVSAVIPTYNEEKSIANCIESLLKQSYKPLEIIVVDDGSKDKTLDILKEYEIGVYKQKHKGPGTARNFGASKAKGEILIFVDADMTFDKDFIKDLIKPIVEGKAVGTFSKNELNANKDNIWSACWNINRNWPVERLIPKDYPDKAPVFRAILKKEFERVGGFNVNGDYTDDWSLSEKLNMQSTAASGATYYHSNPSSLTEVWKQARWIGKNKFISGNIQRKLFSLVKYSLPVSVVIGLIKTIKNSKKQFLIFKIWYDFAVFVSVVKSFFNEQKSK